MANGRTPVPTGLGRWLPVIATVRSYERAWVRRDLVAGLVLTALLVPQGMAYAELAGLPPVTGLYTTVLALLAYAVVGPSRILVLGPDSAIGPLIAATLLPLVVADGDPATAVALASAQALLMGLFCVGAGLARVGRVAELLSKPVRVGFLNGIAVIIVVGQLPKLFGFGSESASLFDEIAVFVDGLRTGETVPAALVVGVASLTVILAFHQWLPKVPGILIAVIGATAISAVLGLADEGVSVVGVVPSGFPSPTFPRVGLDQLGTLAIAAAGMAFVTLADTSALSRSLAARRREVVDPNQEIAALGGANLAAGFFQGFAVSASASRTAVAEATGARTQLTGVVGAVAIIIVLVAANEVVADLPSATLAAIVIAAAISLFDLATLRWLARVRPAELVLSLAALAGVAVIGVLPGIVVAIVLSLADFVWKAWRPYDAELGRLPDRKGYHDIARHPDAVVIPGLVIYRFDAPLFFANADFFRSSVQQAIAERADTIAWVIIAAEPITDVDTTGADVLDELLDELDEAGIVLAIAELKGPVVDRLGRYGLVDRIGPLRFHATLGVAIAAYLAATGTTWVDPFDQPDTAPNTPSPAEERP